MNDSSDGAIAFGLICLLGLGGLIGVGIGASIGESTARKAMRDEAVSEGHGEWKVNEKGEVRFQWKLPE